MTKSIYSDFEGNMMSSVHNFKKKFFLPLLKLLTKLRISANIVSIFSVIIVITFFSLTMIYNNTQFFIVGLWLHLLIDGIDGSLARYQKKDSKKGSIIDVVCDHFGIIFMSLFIYLFNFGDLTNTIIFFSLYTVIIAISLYFLQRNLKFLLVLRPRIYIIAALTYDYFILIGITEILLIITNFFMLFSIILVSVQLKQLKNTKHK